MNLQTSEAILYRLHTEDRDNLLSIVDRHVQGATLLTGVGLWEGTAEPAAIIEIIGVPSDLANIRLLAEDIRQTNAQQMVILTQHPVLRQDIIGEV